VATNDYLLAASYTVSLVVTFANVAYPGTLTETLTINLLHPCKVTSLTTAQVIPDIIFPFGGTTVLTPYTDFSDSVSTQYGIPTLCALVYSLELAASATTYGVTIIPGVPNQISVYTNDPLLKGTQVSLTMSAVATPL